MKRSLEKKNKNKNIYEFSSNQDSKKSYYSRKKIDKFNRIWGDSGESDLELDVMENGDNKIFFERNFCIQTQIKNEFLSKWQRPPPIPIGNRIDDVEFQMIDIDYKLAKSDHDSLAKYSDYVPIIRIFGVTKEENSICCKVHGFRAYLYIELPPKIDIEKDLPRFIYTLNEALIIQTESYIKLKGDFILDFEICERYNMYGYSEKKLQLVKITVSQPRLIPPLKKVLEEKGFFFDEKFYKCPTFESNFLFVLRFMVDIGLTGFSWVKLKKDSIFISKKKVSHCQYEIEVHYEDLIIQSLESNSTLAPLRILSFDIECKAQPSHFPNASSDPIIMIANSVLKQGDTESFITNLFTFRDCGYFSDSDCHVYSNEKEMLLGWRDFVIALDPDVMTGYNISSFDFTYIINRCHVLGIPFATCFGRIINIESTIKKSIFNSKAQGSLESIQINIDGRNQFDLLTYMRKSFKLSSYTLNSVSKEFLGEQKEDVHHSVISKLWDAEQKDRNRLALYCIKDALLPIKLIQKKNSLIEMVEMSRVTSVPLNYLLLRGQSIKVESKLFIFAKECGYVIPAYISKQKNTQILFEGATVIDPIKGFYDNPISTLDFASLYPSIMIAHNLCYTTLIENFGEENLKKLGLKQDDLQKTPNGYYFVKATKKKGILPQILETLLEQRRKAKILMAQAKNENEKSIYNKRQEGFKIVCNSVYGFTGATLGKLPCLEISSSVTAIGRKMIDLVKNKVEEIYSKKNGYKEDAQVIYGDTDSVMVNFKTDFNTTCELGKEAAKEITKFFTPPIKLEWEKCYFPYLLLKKKRYAGVFWTSPIVHDKIDAKGIEIIRRDNCPLVKNVLNEVLKSILLDRDIEKAQQIVREATKSLLMNKISLSDLIITKGYSKEMRNENDIVVASEEINNYLLKIDRIECNQKEILIQELYQNYKRKFPKDIIDSIFVKKGLGKFVDDKEDNTNKFYKGMQPHIELLKKKKRRKEEDLPKLGDRIRYVIICESKGVKTCKKAEDPLYVLEHNLPIDFNYYLDNQLKNPIVNMFTPIIGKEAALSLIKGSHNNHLVKLTPIDKGIVKYFKKFNNCLNCREKIDEKSLNQAVCEKCYSQDQQIEKKTYLSKKSEQNDLEERYEVVLNHCRKCQGSTDGEVLCNSQDCNVFYKRKELLKKKDEASENLNKFKNSDFFLDQITNFF